MGTQAARTELCCYLPYSTFKMLRSQLVLGLQPLQQIYKDCDLSDRVGVRCSNISCK